MDMLKTNISNKCIIAISLALVLITLGTNLLELYKEDDSYKISYEYINVKDMSSPKVTTKKETNKNIIEIFLFNEKNHGTVEEIDMLNKEKPQEIELTALNNTVPTTPPKQIWHLPTEIGQVTQNPRYGHVALDITSPRGYQENIHPVANGRISGIYTDGAGAKIVTVLHDIEGKKYTSQYVHLSQYASNIYVGNIITDIGIFSAVFMISKVAFVYLVVMVLVIYVVEEKRVTFVTEQDKLYRKEHEKASGFVGELVRGVRDIKMLSAEKSFMSELHKKVKDLNGFRYYISSVDRRYNLLRGTLLDISDTGMILLLVYLITKGDLEVASALVVFNYMGRVTSIVNFFSMLLERLKDFNLSSSRIFAIINGDGFSKEKFGVKHLDKVEGNFEFKNVCFAYDEEAVLKDVSFKVKANETVAFVGKSGAGKSTIFSLLCKMYDVNKGDITIDGVSIKELDRESIRDNITIISQNPYIFNMSIRENLRLVKNDASDEEMIEACRMACLEEFINSLPLGYDTIIGEGGVNLSGGQRQRLAIARAFLQKTEIILFDEATSALDNETQASIQKAIDNMRQEYTILIIAHRLSTVINSDRILFLNEGVIEDVGTHKELMKKNTNYRHLYEAEMEK